MCIFKDQESVLVIGLGKFTPGDEIWVNKKQGIPVIT